MATISRRQTLESEGWRRMTVIDEPRLSEIAGEYRRLGYEVHLEPIHPDEIGECTTCIFEAPDRYRTIYVRGEVTGDDDLFEDTTPQ
jgi:hypothetical protein